jgi:hypothetical protein
MVTQLWLAGVPISSVILAGLAIRLFWRHGKSPWDGS